MSAPEDVTMANHNRLYAHCRTCKRAVRLYAEPKYGAPGEVWPVTVALRYRGEP